MTSPSKQVDDSVVTLFSGVIVHDFKAGDTLGMGDRARDDGIQYDTFAKAMSVKEFDQWVMYMGSRGMRILLRDAVPISELGDVSVKVNW